MKRPNFLIFMTDHQRGDTVLPEHPARTPNLDAFLGESVAFTEAYCPSPHCCPARATFHSGLYPSQHGVWNNVCNAQALSRGLKDGVRLWSEDLAAAGYRMHWSGKWHVSSLENPAARGWTEEYLSAGVGTHHGAQWDQFEKLAAQPEPSRRGEGEILRPGWGTYRAYGAREQNDHDDRTAQAALDVLPRLARGSDPWCLFVGTVGPHDPYMVPRRFLDRYRLEDVPLPPSYSDTLADKPRVYQRMREQLFGQLTEREVREAIRHFWAYCSYLDDLFGQLVRRLDETGRREDTVVLYCSDHGDYCGEHGLFCKGIPCFHGAYHVPAVMRWPGGVRDPSRRSDAFVSLADFGPTFLDLAGVRVDRPFAGASLRPFLEGRAPEGWRDALLTQCNGVELYFTQRAIFTREQKYVFNGFDNDELYDLRRDPHEMRNLAQDPEHAKTKQELCRRMWKLARDVDDAAPSGYITVGLAPCGPAGAFR